VFIELSNRCCVVGQYFPAIALTISRLTRFSGVREYAVSEEEKSPGKTSGALS
jgi:hypothetical protein